MIRKGILPNSLRWCFIAVILFLSPHILFSDDHKQPRDCVDQAVKRLNELRSLPEMKYLHTLDGQSVLLNEFYNKGQSWFPHCAFFKKFYYWQSEILEVVSNTRHGMIKHKIRLYYNSLSTFCPQTSNPQKTHGDVAEFYDQSGKFMGLAVYMGDGKYIPLPYDGYQK